MYKAQSPQAEPVRPSWKNLSVAERSERLRGSEYVRVRKDQSHQLRVSADIDSQSNRNHSNRIQNISSVAFR